MPLAILAWLLVLTSRAMAVSDPPVGHAPDLTVVAHQWWWEVRYASGAITANEIHIPVGQALVIRIESEDVVHDFWVPALGRKIDAIPGRPVNIWLQADDPGAYLGTCAEYCGAQHAWMRIRVVAEAPEQFAVWQQQQLARSVLDDHGGSRSWPADIRRQDLRPVPRHSRRREGTGRSGPHAPRGAGDPGAGVMDNPPTELARWLKDPQQIKAGCHMPNLQLSDSEAADLVAYLETLQ